jgi:hypothetical protein
MLHLGAAISVETGVLGARTPDPLSSIVFFAGGWTSCGIFFSEAGCNVCGCVVSRAGIGGTTDVTGFDEGFAPLVEIGDGPGEAV